MSDTNRTHRRFIRMNPFMGVKCIDTRHGASDGIKPNAGWLSVEEYNDGKIIGIYGAYCDRCKEEDEKVNGR